MFMRKKNLCKAVAVFMAAAIFASGCGAKEANAPADSTKPDTAEETNVDSDGREMEGNLYLTGLPIVKEKETISILIDSTTDPETMELFKEFEEKTNVKVEWLAYPNDIATEKKDLMYSSGDYPDAVGGWLLKEIDINKYALNDDVFVPVDELIEKYAPRITYILDNFPGARSAVTAPDGKIYTIPLIAPQPATRFVMHINQSWLDKLKLTMPKTTEELYTVLKAFKEQDPNGNGKADEIPISTVGGVIGRVYGWFGLPDETIHIQMQGGKPVFTAGTEGFKNATKYFARLFQEGLVDPELFTHDSAQYNAKGKTEDALYGVYEDWSGPNVVGGERYEQDYTALPVLSSPECDNPTYRQGDSWIFKTQFAITSAAGNPATIIRWLDFLFDEDNSIQVMMGKYGTVFNRAEDGTLSLVELPAGETTDSMRYRSTVTSLPYAIMPEVHAKFPKSAEELNKNAIDELYGPYIIEEKMPVYWLTAEESQEITTIQTDIDKYVKDKRAAWITGQADIDAEWEDYLVQLDKLGLAKYMEVYTGAIMRSINN
jgi:putative aldouronate transport system substrate-binding protein